MLQDEEEMKEFAVDFSRKLHAGDIVELAGDLGSGKTFFTRSVAEALGASNISSPSFVIKNNYTDGKFPILHFDFYRLEDPGIISEEIKENIKNHDSLIIIEWADSIENVLPDDRYKIYFKVTGDHSRELEIIK